MHLLDVDPSQTVARSWKDYCAEMRNSLSFDLGS